jgi:hypothetical protein
VLEIAERWRIDDEWWRKEISRMYYRVVLVGGRIVVVFQDLLSGNWFLQAAATPLHGAEPLDVLAPRVAAKAPEAPAAPAEQEAQVLPLRRIGVG